VAPSGEPPSTIRSSHIADGGWMITVAEIVAHRVARYSAADAGGGPRLARLFGPL
jgi:hypothetical protein